MFAKELTKFGLTSGEAKVFSCLLQFGDASATEISRKTVLGRTNVYEYAQMLINKGLASQYEKNRKIFFHAENPTILEEIVQGRLREAREVSSLMAQMLPRLEELYKENSNMPLINCYYGESGYRTVFDKIYLEGADKEMFILTQDLDNYEPVEPRYRNALQRKDTTTFLLVNKGDLLGEFNKRDPKENRVTRVIPKEKLEIKFDLVLFEDNLIFGKLGKANFAVTLMKSHEFAQLLKSAFRLVL